MELWRNYVELGNQHLVIYSLCHDQIYSVHYAKEQILFNALECYLKAYYSKNKVQAPKNFLGTHEILNLIKYSKFHDPNFLTWLEPIEFHQIKFDYSPEEIASLPPEKEALVKKQYTDPEFYMLVLLGPSLKYGAYDKKFNRTLKHLITGSNLTTVRIINEIRQKLDVINYEGCVIKFTLKHSALPEKSRNYLLQYL